MLGIFSSVITFRGGEIPILDKSLAASLSALEGTPVEAGLQPILPDYFFS